MQSWWAWPRCYPRRRGSASLAVIVADEWQGRGVGRALPVKVAALAQRGSVRELHAWVEMTNHRALKALEQVRWASVRTGAAACSALQLVHQV